MEFASPMSRPALKQDANILSQGQFAALALLGDEYPAYTQDVSVASSVNKFQASAMRTLGGGEAVMESSFSIYERRGGGLDDNWLSIRLIDKHYPRAHRFIYSDEVHAKMIGMPRGCVQPISLDSALVTMYHNLDANPGPTYKMLGFNKKRESFTTAVGVARNIVEESSTRPVVQYCKPRYGLAGRSKVGEKIKFAAKRDEHKLLGRTVWMADQHEALIAAMFVQPLQHYLHNGFKRIVNGFNKYGNDPTRLTQKLSKYNTFINGDFSSFDLNCGPDLMYKAFDVMRVAFDIPRNRGDMYDHLLMWLEEEIVDSEIVLPTGRVVRKHGAVPSGSGFTAILDSIINAIMWQEVLFRLGFEDYGLFVHGDDNIVGFKIDGNGAERHTKGLKVLEDISRLFLDMYGHVIAVDKTTVATSLFVAFAQPIVGDVPIRDASRTVIRAYRRELEQRLGRPLKFNEKLTLLDAEPIGPAPGMTHRWTYVFSGRAKFLSHYFKIDSSSGMTMCIRPTVEVIHNLYFPERPVKTLTDHENRLISAWVENMGNHHVTNRIMHYLYDVYILKHEGYERRVPKTRLPRRAWYRRIDRQIDLLVEDVAFFRYYRRIELKVRKAYTAVFGGTYANWELIRALRRGKLRLSIGGPLSRVPGPGDIAVHYANPVFVRDLGALGFGLWSKPGLACEFGERDRKSVV